MNYGQFISIVGKSGSGKSTLLNMLTGIDRPTSGEVSINGMVVQTLDEDQIAVWRGRNVGVVFQFYQLMPTLTVIENVITNGTNRIAVSDHVPTRIAVSVE